MKMANILALLLAASLLLAGCSAPEPGAEPTPDPEADVRSTRYVYSMDTVMTLTAYGSAREAALDAAEAEIERLDALLSIGLDSSELSRINASGGGTVSADTGALIEKALALYADTGGCFDLSVYPLMALWGFVAPAGLEEEREEAYHVPAADELAAALALVGADRIAYDPASRALRLGEGQAIDLGAIAKGYTSARIMEIFRAHGVTSGLVSLGGNVQCLGHKPDGSPWRVGIRDPEPEGGEGIVAVIETADRAVITSGGYERFFTDEQSGKTYHHILDPATGCPAESGLLSVTVVTADGALGDGLSTALYVMGLDAAADYWRAHRDSFEAIFVDEAGQLYVTAGLENSVSSTRELQILR